ncbi:MAG: chromate efflux transporter [Methylotenera sp.]|nr:chromate efflux transporter [Methylotenera sp.]MDP1959923.1 chromate efflux transporter [Methylotenera sp.]MDP3086668.1 chromate efflux transporter [Methylotenera sp.]MDP3303981.1 chromate efflux transporter [Methylotenera sp.]MDP3943688.1 chromate efflux transporter [Methylotenera sp.]
MDRAQKNNENVVAPTLREAIGYWFKLGLLSFGGPAGQIAMMHHDLVEKKRWISDKRFLHALNYCMILPGPEAQQLATYIGWLMHRTWGGVIAGGLFVLPSLLILIALSWGYMRFGDIPQVAAMLYGIKPAVVAIVLFAAYRIGLRVLKNKILWGIALFAFVAISLLDFPFPLIILAAGLVGTVAHYYFPRQFNIVKAHQSSVSQHGKAVIDDDTPSPPHAKFSMRKMLKWLGGGIAIWCMAMALLTLVYGWQAVLTQMAWFFTKAALLTFGGAYAVLPYVYQGAVEHYHWLTPHQMIDGLALGETTPGPLIMVVAFVGFVGGWSQAVFGSDSLFLSGAVAAMLVTFFTFLPSFLFIFIGAPLVEATQNNLKLSAPLTAITATVVGVIVSLALFFAQHVFLPTATLHGIDYYAVLLAVLALWLLVKWNLSVIKLVLACAALGLLHFYWLPVVS